MKILMWVGMAIWAAMILEIAGVWEWVAGKDKKMKDGEILLWVGMAVWAATILEIVGVWEWIAQLIAQSS